MDSDPGALVIRLEFGYNTNRGRQERFQIRPRKEGTGKMSETTARTQRALENAVILIPSLEPDERLPAYIEKLTASGFGHVVIVDDGSPAEYQEIFERIDRIDRVKVLHHDVNHGKGIALKTGYTWIRDNLDGISGVITADADGQHTVPDCVHLAEELDSGKRALYLGARDFSLDHVPPKSRSGNRMTSVLFKLLYGVWLNDTQTGLRAFRREDLDFMINVEGARFEYEMNVLIDCVRSDLPIISIPITTVYENENKGTHYHPFRDSMRIFSVLAKGFIRFMGSSLFCVLLDQAIFNLLNLAVFHNGALKQARIILLCTAVARICSATTNFILNKKFVFKLKGNTGGAAWRYALLSLVVIFASAGLVWLLGRVGMNTTIAKILVDTILYFVNFRIQQKWVFHE